jgi:hypothetical protein
MCQNAGKIIIMIEIVESRVDTKCFHRAWKKYCVLSVVDHLNIPFKIVGVGKFARD